MSTGASLDPTMWSTLLHSGLVGSFMGLPHVVAEEQALRSHGARAAIYGLPFEASISRTGANYGPRGIREVSCQFRTYNATFDFDLLDALSPVDCGDCNVVVGNAASHIRACPDGHRRDPLGRARCRSPSAATTRSRSRRCGRCALTSTIPG